MFLLWIILLNPVFGKITLRVSFYGDDEILIKIARGLALTATNKDDPSTFAQYVLLLIHPNDEEQSSLLLPKCYTIKRMELNYQKDAATKLDIEFVALNRNRFTRLYYMDTADNLAAVLGSRSPI